MDFYQDTWAKILSKHDWKDRFSHEWSWWWSLDNVWLYYYQHIQVFSTPVQQPSTSVATVPFSSLFDNNTFEANHAQAPLMGYRSVGESSSELQTNQVSRVILRVSELCECMTKYNIFLNIISSFYTSFNLKWSSL